MATSPDGKPEISNAVLKSIEQLGMKPKTSRRSVMATPTADADGTHTVPNASPSRENKVGMEPNSKLPTTTADADGTHTVPGESLSREKKQGMEPNSKLPTTTADTNSTCTAPGAPPSHENKLEMENVKLSTTTADADGTYAAPGAPSSRENKVGMETSFKMATTAADADGTYTAPGASSSRENKLRMETNSKLPTTTADADGTYTVLDASPSRENKLGMETNSKLPTRTADADGTYTVPDASPSRENNLGIETNFKMTTTAADADGTHTVPDALLTLVKELGMEKYYPCMLSPQRLRTLDISPEFGNEGPLQKQDLARSILRKLMLTNKQSREEDIRILSKHARPKTQRYFDKSEPRRSTSEVPHPMDVLHVLFVCSDFAVRQILAQKLFLCRLAIPFILPNTHQLLLWPLRSIVLEWKDRDEGTEEALVKCKVNMVAFMRFGAKSFSSSVSKNSFSKSNLLNDVLGVSDHATFFHRGSPCGGEKRVTSDGMVEMSHFLPAANQQDAFKQPVLFFNLRGDACSHEVPRQVLLKLATVLVLVLDISQLRHTKVQDMFKETTAMKRESIVLVLTDNDKHSQSDIDDINEHLRELLADDTKNIDIVSTFDEQQNANSLIEEVREAVSKKMTKQPSVSLEEHVTSKLPELCEVDEKTNKHCSQGKELAKSILNYLSKVKYDKVKEKFLPKQGGCLDDLSKAVRDLNRASEDTGNIRGEKEAFQTNIDSIRKKQRRATGHRNFTNELIAMFLGDRKTRDFAIRWVQLRLDELSRQHLPGMHKEKNICWTELIEEMSNGDSIIISQLKAKLQRLQEKIASATFGWEHLMRELGQMYEASVSDRESPESSFLPQVVGQQLLDGHPVELMDGDHGIVPIAWVKAVFQSLAKLAGNKKILVLSVLGIQSSGKSTLLNTMFGLEFAVSAGRCTRGIYAQLLPVKDSNQRFQYLLVLDSEGLRSQQRDTTHHFDNELATLVIGLSDIAMINLKGENIAEMADVLDIVVHAFLRMRLADSPQKRQCMFVHQNVAAVNAREKLADDRQRLQEKLNVMTKQASEALGLSEAITSFNRIINFDSRHDVVYFPELWSGAPPMAAINQEYSRQAAITQRRILQRLTRQFNSFITMEDFVVRTEDMWKGVLSEDFIFSFRNTLVAKAYIDVEKEMARLTQSMEQDMRGWMNSKCEPKIRSCNTEQDLENHWTEIERDLPQKINTVMVNTECVLSKFVERHNASDVIKQWKTEKILSLQNFGEALERQIYTSLRNSKARKLMQLRTNTDLASRQAEIQNKALELAKRLRQEQHTPDMIDQKFDELWRNWAKYLTSGCTNVEINVKAAINTILRKRFTAEERRYLTQQLELTPLLPHSNAVFQLQDITAEHIVHEQKSQSNPTKEECFQNALQIANDIMTRIELKIDALSDEQITTNTAMHGEEVLDEVWRAVEEHNQLPYDHAGFALTPQFKAMMSVRASCVAVERFEAMGARFEEQHGVQAQVAEHKQRVFVLFKSAIDQASDEIKAAEYICATLKTEVEKQATENVKIRLGEKIRLAMGTTKRDFIIAILDEIADQEKYDLLDNYVQNPSQYSENWFKSYVEKHLFDGGESNYSKYASDECERIVDAIKSSIAKASAATQTGSNDYEKWLLEFCRHIKNTVYINSSQLQIDGISSIQNHAQFQSLLSSGLEKCQGEMLKEFQQTKQVSWLGSQSGKIFQDWWGCKAHCPLCGEPCQFQNHEGCHKCIQHKPQAMRGVCQVGWWRRLFWRYNENILAVNSCDFSVSTRSRFHCSGTGCVCGKDEWHAYRDYKKYFPKWDIPPNPAGDGGKYWQWVMARFQRELENSYPGKTLQLHDSWKRITPEEAKESLRKW